MASDAERQAKYRLDHPERFHNQCPDCGNRKFIKSKRCSPCRGKSQSGEKSPYFKGGYENHKMHGRLRLQRLKQMKGEHTEQEWESLKAKFGYMCLCCKQMEPAIKLQKDHIVPVSKKGCTDNIANIQPLCEDCNSRKHTKVINYIELHENVGAGL